MIKLRRPIHHVISLTIACLSLSALIGAQASAEDLARETLGEVRVGVPFMNILRAFGAPVRSSKALQDAQRGCTAQVHFYDKRGVEVEVCGQGKSALVSSVRVVKNPTAVTGKGVRVGDTVEKILARYSGAKQMSDAVVVEDPALGVTLRFLLEGGRVFEINFYQDHTQRQRNTPKIQKRHKPKLGW